MITFEQVLDCVLEEAEIRLDDAINGPAFERAKQKYALEQASRPRRPKKPRNKRGHWVFVEDRDYDDDDDDWEDDFEEYMPPMNLYYMTKDAFNAKENEVIDITQYIKHK